MIINSKYTIRILLASVGLFVYTLGYGHHEHKGVSAKVVNVIDGNTIEIMTADKEIVKIMFSEVDSPELEQEFGQEAKAFTEKLLLKKKVNVIMKGKDRWGNRLASISLNNGKNAEEAILKAGLAWHNMKSKDQSLKEIEMQSKEKKKGLWSKEEPTAPWIFRRQQTMKVARSQ